MATHAEGTFLTPVGDYRYLEGNIMNDKLYLSTFDGNHAFLFIASKDRTTNWLETIGQERACTKRGPESRMIMQKDARCGKPHLLKKGFDRIDFTFKDMEGNL